MADLIPVRITNLPEADSPVEVEALVIVVQDGIAKQATVADLGIEEGEGGGGTSLVEPLFVTTSNDTLSGLSARDGYTPLAGDLALAAGQTTTANNGLWLTAIGAWTRPDFFDADEDVVPGTQWQVKNGTLGAATTWRLKTGNTIAGAKVIERIDTNAVLGIDVTRPPYNVLGTGNEQDKINLAITDARALVVAGASGAEVRLSRQITVSEPIVLKQGVILQGMIGGSKISANFSAGPIIWANGDGGIETSGTALSAAEDLSFLLDSTQSVHNRKYLDITMGGVYLEDFAGFNLEFEFAASAVGGGHIISCSGRLHTSDTLERLFQVKLLSTGAVKAWLRVGGVDYILQSGAGLVTFDGTTKYHLALDYDGTNIRLYVNVMGSGSSGAADVTQAATGTVSQYPFERIHMGNAYTDECPAGSQTESSIDGRVGSIRIGAEGRRASSFTVPTNVLALDGATKGVCFISPRTSNKFADGELWKYTIGGDAGSGSGTGFIPALSDGAAGTCINSGVRNVEIACSTNASVGRGVGIMTSQAIGFSVENVTVASCYAGIVITNNSYLSRVSGFHISNNARGILGLQIGGACGVTTVSGKNQIEGGKNSILIALSYSGIVWDGTTYCGALPRAYIGLLMSTPATMKLCGISFTDENSSQAWGKCGIYFGPQTGSPVVDMQTCGVEFFHTTGTPIIISNQNTGTFKNAKLRFGGRVIGFGSDPAFKFTGDPDDVQDVITSGFTYSGNAALTNAPGKVRTEEPLASVLEEEQTASIGTTDFFDDPPVAGLYAVNIYLQTTTADAGAGTVLATIGWTDAAGATTRDTATLSLATAGRLVDTVICDADGIASITYATTVVTAGTSEYRMRLTVQRID